MNEISISNIAWDPIEDDFIYKILLAEGITSIDVAPGKYFKDIKATSTSTSSVFLLPTQR